MTILIYCAIIKIMKEVDNMYQEWMDKYGKLSEKTCIMCGKPGKLTNSGWIMPLCEDCKKKVQNNEL